MEHVQKSKGSNEKVNKALEGQMVEVNAKFDEYQRNISDISTQKVKLQQESADLTRQLEEAEHQIGTLTKQKNLLTGQYDEAKAGLEEESRVGINVISHITS